MIKRLVIIVASAMFLFNAVPHIVQGITGKCHMTPFALESSAPVNVVWGWINLVIGGVLLKLSDPKSWTKLEWAAFCAGGFVVSIGLAVFWSDQAAKLPWH